MKGLQQKTTDGIFLVIKHGGIVQESKNPREGFEPVEVVNPRSGDSSVKYIKRYHLVEALIKRIEWYDREFQDTRFLGWKLYLDADGTACVLDLPFETRACTRFMKLVENIDFTQPVEFSAWKDREDKTAFIVKQNDLSVPQKYTKDNPGDCPEPTKAFGGKWNFAAQEEFLHGRMMKVVIPKLQALYGDTHETAPTSNGDSNGHSTGDSNGNAGPLSAQDPLVRKSLLDVIKISLKDYAAQNKVSTAEAIEKWFSTRVWSQVEDMDTTVLKAVSDKLSEELIPF